MLERMSTLQDLSAEIRRMNASPQAMVGEGPNLHAARMVAQIIVDRWEMAGVQGWARDAVGRPIPVEHGLQHKVVESKLRSPTGKALFFCVHCRGTALPVPPRGACVGAAPFTAIPSIAAELLRGVLYIPTGPHDLPYPPPVTDPETLP